MDISIAFSILKPLLQGFSLNISAFVFGYGGLHTFVESDRITKAIHEADVVLVLIGDTWLSQLRDNRKIAEHAYH